MTITSVNHSNDDDDCDRDIDDARNVPTNFATVFVPGRFKEVREDAQ